MAEAALERETGVLARAAQGDEEAFAALVARHARMVFGIALHFFSDRALAEDVAQDVFVEMFKNAGAFESEAHLEFWLRRVTVRRCIDRTRWFKRWRLSGLEAVGGRATEPSGADFLESARLRRLVARLPLKLRAAVVLRYQEDLEPAEIAAVLGCPVPTVKSRLRTALELLRRRLK